MREIEPLFPHTQIYSCSCPISASSYTFLNIYPSQKKYGRVYKSVQYNKTVQFNKKTDTASRLSS